MAERRVWSWALANRSDPCFQTHGSKPKSLMTTSIQIDSQSLMGSLDQSRTRVFLEDGFPAFDCLAHQCLNDRAGMGIPCGDAPLQEIAEDLLHPGEVLHLLTNLDEAIAGHGLHCSTIAPVGEVKQSANLVQREPQALRSFDKSDAIDQHMVIQANAASWSGNWKQSAALVVPNRLDTNMRFLGQATDGQRSKNTCVFASGGHDSAYLQSLYLRSEIDLRRSIHAPAWQPNMKMGNPLLKT